jgi:hypothetical protein
LSLIEFAARIENNKNRDAAMNISKVISVIGCAAIVYFGLCWFVHAIDLVFPLILECRQNRCAYLNKIGLPYSAVVYITTASPDSITWLSKSDAEELEIEVSFFATPSNVSPQKSEVTKAAKQDTGETGGYLV